MGSRALPTILNSYFNQIEVAKSHTRSNNYHFLMKLYLLLICYLSKGLLNFLHILPSKKRKISVLHNTSGIIKPGRLEYWNSFEIWELGFLFELWCHEIF